MGDAIGEQGARPPGAPPSGTLPPPPHVPLPPSPLPPSSDTKDTNFFNEKRKLKKRRREKYCNSKRKRIQFNVAGRKTTVVRKRKGRKKTSRTTKQTFKSVGEKFWC